MLEEAVSLMSKGDWCGAEAELDRVLDQRPTFAPGYAHKGLCLYHQSKFAEAAVWFERATNLDPHYWEAGTKLVQCLDRLMRYEEAYALALKWQRERPNDATLAGLVHGLGLHAEGPKEAWQLTVNYDQFHYVELAQG